MSAIQLWALFLFMLFASSSSFADGRTTPISDHSSNAIAVNPHHEDTRLTFPPLKNHHDPDTQPSDDPQEDTADLVTDNTPSEPKPTSSNFPHSAATIVTAQPFDTKDEPKTENPPGLSPTTNFTPMKTVSSGSRAPIPAPTFHPDQLPPNLSPERKPASFAPNLSDLTLDNPQAKKPPATKPSNLEKSAVKNNSYPDDMPHSYESSVDKSRTKPSEDRASGIPISTMAEPGYRFYTVTDPNQMDHINMDCVVSVDQDPATGAFMIKAKESCK